MSFTQKIDSFEHQCLVHREDNSGQNVHSQRLYTESVSYDDDEQTDSSEDEFSYLSGDYKWDFLTKKQNDFIQGRKIGKIKDIPPTGGEKCQLCMFCDVHNINRKSKSVENSHGSRNNHRMIDEFKKCPGCRYFKIDGKNELHRCLDNSSYIYSIYDKLKKGSRYLKLCYGCALLGETNPHTETVAEPDIPATLSDKCQLCFLCDILNANDKVRIIKSALSFEKGSKNCPGCKFYEVEELDDRNSQHQSTNENKFYEYLFPNDKLDVVSYLNLCHLSRLLRTDDLQDESFSLFLEQEMADRKNSGREENKTPSLNKEVNENCMSFLTSDSSDEEQIDSSEDEFSYLSGDYKWDFLTKKQNDFIQGRKIGGINDIPPTESEKCQLCMFCDVHDINRKSKSVTNSHGSRSNHRMIDEFKKCPGCRYFKIDGKNELDCCQDNSSYIDSIYDKLTKGSRYLKLCYGCALLGETNRHTETVAEPDIPTTLSDKCQLCLLCDILNANDKVRIIKSALSFEKGSKNCTGCKFYEVEELDDRKSHHQSTNENKFYEYLFPNDQLDELAYSRLCHLSSLLGTDDLQDESFSLFLEQEMADRSNIWEQKDIRNSFNKGVNDICISFLLDKSKRKKGTGFS